MYFDFHNFLTRAEKFYSKEEFLGSQYANFWYNDLFDPKYSINPNLAVLASEPIEFDYSDCNSDTGMIDNYVFSSAYIPKPVTNINCEMFCFMKGYPNNGLRLTDIFISIAGGDLSVPVIFHASVTNYCKYMFSKDESSRRYPVGNLFMVGGTTFELANNYDQNKLASLSNYELIKFKNVLDLYPYVLNTFFGSRFLDATLYKEVPQSYSNVFDNQLSRNTLYRMLGLK